VSGANARATGPADRAVPDATRKGATPAAVRTGVIVRIGGRDQVLAARVASARKAVPVVAIVALAAVHAVNAAAAHTRIPAVRTVRHCRRCPRWR